VSLIFGCQSGSTTNSQQAEQIKELETRLHAVETLANSSAIAIVNLDDRYAHLNTESETYDLMRNRFGVFPVTCKSVKPHLDGYEFKVDIGNSTNMVFHGAKVRCRWEEGILKFNKEFEVTNTFLPRIYTPIKITINPLTSKAVNTVEVFLVFDQLSLYRQ
jgi:hypothetical protein